ncbi:hypothetical protein [Hymenobacter sp. B1770]|uniref:hypothetical protein n=1 Tax=Hymenobacter sp. B1770 TaxID=1718788 RepID=UPI003CFA3EBA
MKKCYAPLLFLLLLLACWLGLPTVARAQVYYLELNKTPITVPGRAVTVEQVFDARPRRAGIGTVHRGLNNIPQRADLRPSVAQALTSWVQAQLPARSTDHPVALVLRELKLTEEISAFSEKARVELALDVYARLPDGYHYVLSAAEQVESKGMETTAQHPGNLAQALQRCLAQCQTIAWEKLPAQSALTLAELEQLGHAPAPTLTYAILSDSVRPKGYYPTFLAFRNNQPVTEPALTMETTPRTAKGWEGTQEVVPTLAAVSSNGKDALRKAWGFSDGQQVYILHNRHYQPLVRSGNEFRFVGFNLADPGAVGTAGYLAGPLGGAIAAAATSGRPGDYTLNMVTGGVSPFADAGTTPLADTATIYVYRRASSVPGSVRVLLNGTAVAELGEYQFVAIPYTDKLREASFCLQTAAGRCMSFIPAFGGSSYVEVARNFADATKPALEKANEKKGVFDLRVIRARTKTL